MKKLLIMFAGLVLATTAQAASFDCTKAGTKVEKLICADSGLSKLDEELNAAYKAALKNEKQAEAIKQAQKQWLKERNSCVDANCVMSNYQKRLLLMAQMPHNVSQIPISKNTYRSSTYSPLYKVWQEAPYEPLSEICEEFTAMLNAFGPEEPQMRCEQKLHPAFSKFKPIELQSLPSKDNFKYFSAIRDLAIRETIKRGDIPHPTQPGDLERLFEEKERLGGYKYYLVTTDRYNKNKTITMLIQERQGDCRIKNSAMDSARRISYEWDMATESVVKRLFSFQSIFTYEGESMQGDGLLVSYWDEVELPTSSGKSGSFGKSGSIWVDQAYSYGMPSRICNIIYNGKH